MRLGTQREISAFTDGQRDLKHQAKTIIDQGGDLSSIPRKLMLQIDIPGRRALLDYAMAHGNPASDPVMYYSLKNQALDDPAGFQLVDLSNQMGKLNAKDYGDLQQLQANLKGGQTPPDLPLLQTYKLNTDKLLRQLGLEAVNDNLAKDPKKERQAALIRKAVDLHVAATETATGRKMTPVDHGTLLQQAATQTIPKPSSLDEGSAALVGAVAPTVGSSAAAGETLVGATTLASEGALATAGPLAFLVAGILAATSKPTAGPALDEYQSPITTELPNSPSVPLPTILQRKTSKGAGKGIDCNEELAQCAKLCFESKNKGDRKGIYYTGLNKCMKGCLPVGCGGNATSRAKR